MQVNQKPYRLVLEHIADILLCRVVFAAPYTARPLYANPGAAAWWAPTGLGLATLLQHTIYLQSLWRSGHRQRCSRSYIHTGT